MGLSIAPRLSRAELSEFIAEKMGLHFPPERWPDLRRGLEGVAKEFGFADVAACVDWLLTSPLTKVQLQALASHLTVGETYFFREKRTFEVLADSVLPELIRLRRNSGRRLRLWSAACLQRAKNLIPGDFAASGLPRFGRLACEYSGDRHQRTVSQKSRSRGLWGMVVSRIAALLQRALLSCPLERNHYEILPEIKKLVTFANLNLAEDNYPALATDTNAMDVIFCRNVLMYFTPSQAAKAVRNLRCALVDDGWLAVSPCEASQTLFSRFAPANFPGAILYKKSDAPVRTAPIVDAAFDERIITDGRACARNASEPFPPQASAEEPAQPAAPPTPVAQAASLYQQGRYVEAADTLLNWIAHCDAPGPPAFSLLARALANQGKLADALAWCDRWVAADKIDPSGHYLRAVVLQELGDTGQARRSLQRATYLCPGICAGSFRLGEPRARLRQNDEADKHFNNALRVCWRPVRQDDVLPESGWFDSKPVDRNHYFHHRLGNRAMTTASSKNETGHNRQIPARAGAGAGPAAGSSNGGRCFGIAGIPAGAGALRAGGAGGCREVSASSRN